MAADLEPCFVIMPFGEKLDVAGHAVDFDEIHTTIIQPAIAAAGLAPVRCDQIEEAGNIHRRMITHIHGDSVAVVDISLLNANVFYELGVRHAFRQHVTVIIRRAGTDTPFNVANLNVIEYDETADGDDLEGVRSQITSFIKNGMASGETDNVVQEVLELEGLGAARPIRGHETIDYVVPDSTSTIGLITGEIQRVKGVDVWVNSENTEMQMARFYDWSVSSVIRYLGATRNAVGHVTDDNIANALAEVMSGAPTVPPGIVVPTTPGELRESHGVKWVFHAAAVTGELGRGYRAIPDTSVCVTRALELMDSPQVAGDQPHSIAFPLLGAGVSPAALDEITTDLIRAALDYLASTPDTDVERIYFLCWSERELAVCRRTMARLSLVTAD